MKSKLAKNWLNRQSTISIPSLSPANQRIAVIPVGFSAPGPRASIDSQLAGSRLIASEQTYTSTPGLPTGETEITAPAPELSQIGSQYQHQGRVPHAYSTAFQHTSPNLVRASVTAVCSIRCNKTSRSHVF